MDTILADDILGLLKRVNTEKKIAILMPTHSPLAAEFGNMKIKLDKGELQNLDVKNLVLLRV